jgi:hypothetical protein
MKNPLFTTKIEQGRVTLGIHQEFRRRYRRYAHDPTELRSKVGIVVLGSSAANG